MGGLDNLKQPKKTNQKKNMSNTAVQTTKPKSSLDSAKPSALAIMATRISVEPAKLLDTLKSTVFKNASNEELMALVVVANTYDLNPFLKEIYAFPAKGGGIVPIVSVDGWNKMLVRHPEFDGIEFEFTDDEAGNLHSCTATIFLKTRSHPVKITEFLAECKRNTDPWNNMPRRMLRNRTLCQAARVAFGFSGVMNEDEAANVVDVQTTVITEPPPKMVAAPDVRTPQVQLEAMVIEAGFDFTTFQKWGVDSGNVENADSIASFSELPTDTAKRLLRSQAGLVAGLKLAKGGNE